jgi:hypothetical protein
LELRVVVITFIAMKQIFAFCFVMLVSYRSFAQKRDSVKQPAPVSPIAKVIKFVGVECAVTDSLYGYQVISDSMTLLDLGGKYPNYVMDIVLKGNGFNFKPTDFGGKWVYVTGKVEMYRGKLQIVVTDPTNIRIFTRVY